MDDSEGHFDHFWGTLNVNDFETKPFFDSHLIHNDVIRDVNCSFESVFYQDQPVIMKCGSSDQDEELKGSIIAETRPGKFCSNQVKHSSYPSSQGPAPVVQLPYLTIPPGISPAALLESPTMLSNSQKSPTTGTFPLVPCNDDDSEMKSLSPAAGTDNMVVDSFGLFKPPGDFAHMPCTSSARDQPSTSSKVPAEFTGRDSTNFSNMEANNDSISIPNSVTLQSPPADIVHQQATLLRECIKVEKKTPPFFEPEQKRILASTKTSIADGYCWRKYGQKHVKGSEFPRSYYKCNNSNCLVKKKVERSHNGIVTEIVYTGVHNHPRPHLRLSLACQAASIDMLDTCDVSESPKLESWTGWRCNQLSDWTADGLEGTSLVPVLNGFCDPLSSNHEKSAIRFGSMQTPENATAIVSQNGDDQDGMMQGSPSPNEDADGDESDPKRRKREMFTSEAYLPTRSTREPRIILQIESEIDVLDDGYRWRKYGQKVVKGNPNPRSYYKCTSAGCPVRKHVERASEDIKSVITTYEGKHNHEVPTTKAMGAPTVGQSPQNVSDATNHVFTLPRNPNASNAQMKIQDFPNHYQMKPALGNEFSRSPFLGDFVSDMKIGVSSIYPMKFPGLHSPMNYNPFMRNFNGGEFQTPNFGVPLMHDLPMINASRNTNMTVSGIHPSNHPRPGGVVQSSVGIQQQIKENDFMFFKPKEEQKDDNSFATCLAATPDNEKPSSTAFCRAVGNFPSRNTF